MYKKLKNVEINMDFEVKAKNLEKFKEEMKVSGSPCDELEIEEITKLFIRDQLLKGNIDTFLKNVRVIPSYSQVRFYDSNEGISKRNKDIIEVLNSLVKIKTISNKLNLILKSEEYDYKENLPSNSKMPETKEYIEKNKDSISTLEGLKNVINGYINIIPQDLIEYLEDIDMGYLTNMFFNELELREAKDFLDLLIELKEMISETGLFISPYDLNDMIDIPFEDIEDAEEFIKEYGSPGTLFSIYDGNVFELDNF